MKNLCFVKGILCAMLIGLASAATSNTQLATSQAVVSSFEGGTVEIFQGKAAIFLAFSSSSINGVQLIDNSGISVYSKQLSENVPYHFIPIDHLINGSYTLVVTTDSSDFVFNIIV